MGQVIKAQVLSGRYQGQTVRITNVSSDDQGRQKAACMLQDGSRANIPMSELSLIKEEDQSPLPERQWAKTSSMPFVSGSSNGRTLTHTKNMQKMRVEKKAVLPSSKSTPSHCKICGQEYNLEERKGRPGKITCCPSCADEAG